MKNWRPTKKYTGVLHIYFVSGKLSRFEIAETEEKAHNPAMCINKKRNPAGKNDCELGNRKIFSYIHGKN